MRPRLRRLRHVSRPKYFQRCAERERAPEVQCRWCSGSREDAIAAAVSAAQRESERRALIGRRLGPYDAAVQLDDTAHDRQADTGALVAVVRMKAAEHVEHFFALLHRKTDAVVAHAPRVQAAVALACN